jgi:hypothetical protein
MELKHVPIDFSKSDMDSLKVLGSLSQNENFSPLVIGLQYLRDDLGCSLLIFR